MTEDAKAPDSPDGPAAPLRAEGIDVPAHKKLVLVDIDPKEEARRTKLPRTTGETAYDWINFWAIKGLILAATAAIAYPGKFGKETNLIRKVQAWCVDHVALPLQGHGEKLGALIPQKIGGKVGIWLGAATQKTVTLFGFAFASTMVLCHGGNVVAPVVQWFENHRRGIIAKVNHRWGKPGEEEIGNEKFEFLPHQTASDVVKGRVMAWLTVFSAFFTAYLLVPKLKEPAMHPLDAFEEGAARWIGRLGKTSPFGAIPLTQDLHELAKAEPARFLGHEGNLFRYRLTRILALDFFATSAGILIWNLTSRVSALARKHDEPFMEALKHRVLGRPDDAKKEEDISIRETTMAPEKSEDLPAKPVRPGHAVTQASAVKLEPPQPVQAV
jgi:hypothetical protein